MTIWHDHAPEDDIEPAKAPKLTKEELDQMTVWALGYGLPQEQRLRFFGLMKAGLKVGYAKTAAEMNKVAYGGKFDRNAYHRTYMKEYMRQYRARKRGPKNSQTKTSE